MRVLQFAKRSVVTVALVSLALAGCSGDSGPDAPFNPAGANADLDAMNATFASPAFASFSTMSIMFDAALGGAPIIAHSAAALDVKGKSPQQIRAAAARVAQRMAATMRKAQAEGGLNVSMAALPAGAAGRTFVYDAGTSSYVVSDRPLLPLNKVRFILYAVDPVTFVVDPATETGYVELTDLSGGTTQAARVQVVSGDVTYIDYTVTATSGTSSARITMVGYVTDGVTQANVTLRSTFSFTAGLTLTYSLDLPQRDVSIDLTVGVSDVSDPTSPITVSLTMSGPNGTVQMNGQFTETTGTLNIRISGHAFATITTNGAEATIARNDGQPLTDDEFNALQGVFEIQASAFVSFDQLMAPVGAFFTEPA